MGNSTLNGAEVQRPLATVLRLWGRQSFWYYLGMARKRTKKKSNRTVIVKGHTRTPRGKNAGKKAVHVPGYKRRKPKPKAVVTP